MFGRTRVRAESGHRCKFCRLHIHGICGMPTDEEGYSGTRICSACSRKDTPFVPLTDADDDASMDIASDLDNDPLHNLTAGNSEQTAAKEASILKKESARGLRLRRSSTSYGTNRVAKERNNLLTRTIVQEKLSTRSCARGKSR